MRKGYEAMITIEPRRGRKVKVTFEVLADAVDGPVSVVGDFNDWAAGATPMQRENGNLTASVMVDRGSRFAFRYLGDGGRWFDDDGAHAYEPNGMGGSNGVVEIAAPDAKVKQKA
jgi:1,4-alpha-glucan branching enzyme